MTTEAYIHLPLARAALCAGCDAIYRLEEPACPACGDHGRIVLGGVIPPMVPYPRTHEQEVAS